jgi:Tectonin domain
MELSRKQIGFAFLVGILIVIFGVYKIIFEHKPQLKLTVIPNSIDTSTRDTVLLISWNHEDYDGTIDIYFVDSTKKNIIKTLLSSYQNKPSQDDNHSWSKSELREIVNKKGFIRIKSKYQTVDSPEAFTINASKWSLNLVSDKDLSKISVSKNGLVWGINSDKEVFKYSNSEWTKTEGNLTNISVGSDGTAWGVDEDGLIYKWNGSQWTTLGEAGGNLKQISVGRNGIVYGVNRNDEIFKWTVSGWYLVGGALINISVASDGTVWGVNKTNEVFKWQNNTWGVPFKGNMKQISVGKDGLVWAIGIDNRVYKLNDEETDWAEPIPKAKLSYISVASDGTTWGINNEGLVYRLVYR